MIFGGHCSGGIKKAIDRAEEIGADALQLFVQSPRAWRFPDHDAADLKHFRTRREEAGLGAVVVHSLYLVNLASPNDDLYGKSVSTMRSTVETACAIGADSVVFHVGSHQGAGVTIGRSPAELATIIERLGRHPLLGVCLDSCHLYASGYDITEREELDRVLHEVDELIGLDRLNCLHVNDSKAPLGSNRDRHENLGDGLMGEKLGVFLSHPKLQKLPALLETHGPEGHGPTAREVKRLRQLHGRWAKPSRASKASRVK